jgi:dTDP-4-amino-4,6-dideoxygalactose transaminase
VKLNGAKAILYDNLPLCWNSSEGMLRQAMHSSCKAVVVNHTFGIRFEDYEKLSGWNIPVIEDCCHAFATEINHKKIGIHSVASFYSFNSTKFLAGGEGGAVATNDKNLFDQIVKWKIEPGMSDLSASFVLNQILNVPFYISRRREIAEYYIQHLGMIANDIKGRDSLYFRFPILTVTQEDFLKSKKVAFRLGVDTLLSDKVNCLQESVKNTLDVKKKTISVPIYPSLTNQELEVIVHEIKCLWK